VIRTGWTRVEVPMIYVRAMRIAIVLLLCAVTSASADPTNVLDFELVQRGSGYVLRDPAFEVTFPGKPKVTAEKMKAPNGTELTTGSAMFDRGDNVFMFGVVPIGNDSAYDPKVGLAAARDRSLAAMKATLVSETAVKVGGIEARHVVAKLVLMGKQYRIDTYLQWDPEHRMTVMLMSGTVGKDESADGKAFVASYVRTAGTHSPLDPPPPADGVAVSMNALDFKLVRKGASYVMRDAAVEITFPRRPLIASGPVDLSRFVIGGDAYQGETDQLGVAFVVVPPGQKFDAKKELVQMQKTVLAEFKKLKTKDAKATIAGIDGKRVTLTGKVNGRNMRGEMVLLWDDGHRIAVVAYAYTEKKTLTAEQRAFFDSLAIHADGKAPAIPAEK
jgi:hypothetical protein